MSDNKLLVEITSFTIRDEVEEAVQEYREYGYDIDYEEALSHVEANLEEIIMGDLNNLVKQLVEQLLIEQLEKSR